MSFKALPAPTKIEEAAARQLEAEQAAQAAAQQPTQQQEPLVIESATSRGTFGDSQYLLKTNKGDFYYVPQDYVNRGYATSDYQYYNPEFLNQDFLKTAQPVNLDPKVLEGKDILSNFEKATSGYLFPAQEFEQKVPAWAYYNPIGDGPKNKRIAGISYVEAEGPNSPPSGFKYVYEGSGGNQISFVNEDTRQTTRTYTVQKSGGWLGDRIRDVAKFVGSIPLLTEATLLIPGAGPAIYAGLKGAQLGMAGKSPLEAGLQVAATVAAPQIGKALLPAEIAAIPGATTAAGSTVAGLLSGQPLGQALQGGLAAGAGGVVGGQVAGATGSQFAGQVAGGTTAGLLAGKDAVTSAISSLIGASAQQAGNLVNRALFSSGSSNMEDSFWNDLYAADAEQLAAQGIGQQQIADILQFSGADPFVAYDAAQLATQGLKAGDILKNLNQLTAPTTGGVPSGTAGKLASTAARSLLQRLTGTGGTAAGGAAGGNLANTLLNALLGTGTGSGGLLSRGIDYATAEKIANQLRREGATITEQAQQAAQAAQVPFTPYTVTTGLGTGTFGPTGATVTPTAPYSAIQQEALQQAQEALGAISPAQASQTLFGQLEGLQAPFRQRQQEELLSRLGARGLLGFGQNLPTVGGGVGTVNPYMESLLSAQAAQQTQNALAAQQFGTQEAARQQALAQALTTQGMGIDQQTAALLTQAANIGAIPMNLALTNRGRQLEASLRGLGLQIPFSTSAANIQAGQTGLLGQTAKDVSSAVLKEILG